MGGLGVSGGRGRRGRQDGKLRRPAGRAWAQPRPWGGWHPLARRQDGTAMGKGVRRAGRGGALGQESGRCWWGGRGGGGWGSGV